MKKLMIYKRKSCRHGSHAHGWNIPGKLDFDGTEAVIDSTV
jgi:hypothetical protein